MLNILILCTHNSARSVLAEAMFNHLALRLGIDARAFSAGAAPSGRVHPQALAALRAANVDVAGLSSKNMDLFAQAGAPEMLVVITVCDSAAGEVCPIWPGHPASAHWGYADPSEGAGSDDEKHEAFRKTLHAIHQRLELLINLPADKLDKTLLQHMARELSREAVTP